MKMFECAAILFDLDGVLVDSTGSVTRQWQRWAQENHIDPQKVVEIAHGVRSLEVIRTLAPHLDATAEVLRIEKREAADQEGVAVMPGAAALLKTICAPVNDELPPLKASLPLLMKMFPAQLFCAVRVRLPPRIVKAIGLVPPTMRPPKVELAALLLKVSVEVLDALPTTASGKVQKHEIVRQLAHSTAAGSIPR